MPPAKKARRKPPRPATTSKTSRTRVIRSNENTNPDMANHATYNKLMKKGMSEAQARAFSHHAGGGLGGKSKGGKTSKPTTRKLTRSKKK
jgi:hypothetical protein